jgi:hypothetical protein
MASAREMELRAGHVEKWEYSSGTVFFYWEPAYNEHDMRAVQAFTIEHGMTRLRIADFDEAVAALEAYTRKLDINAALQALGIEGEVE